jgi:hypothetical protein
MHTKGMIRRCPGKSGAVVSEGADSCCGTSSGPLVTSSKHGELLRGLVHGEDDAADNASR